MGVPSKRAFHPETRHDETLQVNYLSTALLATLQERINPLRPASAWAKFPLGKKIPILGAVDKSEENVDLMNAYLEASRSVLLAGAGKRVPVKIAVINGASPGMVSDSEFDREFKKTTTGAIMQRIKMWVGNSSAVAVRMITYAAAGCGEDTHGEFLSFQKVVPQVFSSVS
ncbi:LOW QUALITY PROTEIN: hypothetical protein QC761_0060640 [Podospora bellae-mahoneyi]|uniref:Uncharacterized protein n=1 Tax=Podospora bellae-mahoneyi TaxID=2093777 RepID=A0ABR0FI03_9PEZI|nr:LOW QUALITY PROTEIN: hypothetical protein QC761_0060640 [Podospora bellae-mahoneyi]